LYTALLASIGVSFAVSSLILTINIGSSSRSPFIIGHGDSIHALLLLQPLLIMYIGHSVMDETQAQVLPVQIALVPIIGVFTLIESILLLYYSNGLGL